LTLTRTRRLALGVSGMCLLVAACGGGDSASPFPAAPTPTPAPIPVPAPPAPSSIWTKTCTTTAPVTATVGPFHTYGGDCLVSYRLSTAEFDSLKQYTEVGAQKVRDNALAAFRANFRDEFDWVMFIWDLDGPPAGAPVGIYQQVYENKPPRCIDTIRTDCPRLLGTLTLTFAELARYHGLDPFRGGPVLHELLHQVANRVLPTVNRGHWGFAGVGGQLGGWKPETFKDLGNGQYQVAPFGLSANGGNSVAYAPLELYLLGLLSEPDVPPVIVAEGVQVIDPAKVMFSAISMKTYTAKEIGELLGEKRPDATKSRTSLRMAVVVLTDKERLTEGRVRVMSIGAGHLTFEGEPGRYSVGSGLAVLDTFNFWSATGGRARLQVTGLSTFGR